MWHSLVQLVLMVQTVTVAVVANVCFRLKNLLISLNDAKAVQTESGKTFKVLTVPMVLKTADGGKSLKPLPLSQGEYPVVVNHKVVNRSGQNWEGQMFGTTMNVTTLMIQANRIKVFSRWVLSSGGAWGLPEEHYNKLKFANFNEEKLNVEVKGGSVAMVQHYFVSAWIPGDLKLTQANGQPYVAN